MTPDQVAAEIAREAVADAVTELMPLLHYREQHDPEFLKLNRLMKPTQQQEAA